jgi:hypothetical protein
MAEHLSDKNSETTNRSKIFAMVTTLKSREYTPHAVETFFENTELNDTDRFILISNDDPNAFTFAYSQKIGHLFAERSATPGQPVDNLVIPVFTSL